MPCRDVTRLRYSRATKDPRDAGKASGGVAIAAEERQHGRPYRDLRR